MTNVWKSWLDVDQWIQKKKQTDQQIVSKSLRILIKLYCKMHKSMMKMTREEVLHLMQFTVRIPRNKKSMMKVHFLLSNR